MGELVGAFILPHPPIIVPEIGKQEEVNVKKTINSVKNASKIIKKLNPKTVIIVTPHNINFSDYIYISGNNKLVGNFSDFGCSNISLEYENDIDLLSDIVEESKKEKIHSGSLNEKDMKKFNIESKLDHGALVPLYFINKELSNFKILHISLAGFNLKDMYRFGKCILKAIDKSVGKYVFVASGDLSHKVNEKSSYGYSKYGKKFDNLIMNLLEEKNTKDLLNIDEDFCEKAAQCGLKSVVMLLGTLDAYNYKVNLNSYEAPFGIGYLVASFLDISRDKKDKKIIENSEKEYKSKITKIRENEHQYVKLARESLEFYIENKGIMKISDDLDNYILENKAGVFVSIKKYGILRGCIGTIFPQKESIAEEIINNAINSGISDYRFNKIDINELDYLVYSVDILQKPVKIKSIVELDVVKYGIIVKNDNKSGLLLPNLDGVDNINQQLNIALDKAGISKNENYSIEKFEVIRYK